MGSENLRAIMTHGEERISPADKAAAQEDCPVLGGLRSPRTTGCTSTAPRAGSRGWIAIACTTRNFRDGSFEHALAITGKTMSDTDPDRPRDVLRIAARPKNTEVEVKEAWGVAPISAAWSTRSWARSAHFVGIGDLAAVGGMRSG